MSLKDEPGALLRLLCLLAYHPRLVSAAYSCTSLGTECLNRIYTGVYSTEAAAEAARGAGDNGDFSCKLGHIGFQGKLFEPLR